MTTSPTDHERRSQVARGFTPAAPIRTRDLFAGRLPQLQKVISTIEEPGQHAVLFGERGVGKTSLANIIHATLGGQVPCAKAACDSRDKFETVWRRLLEEMPVEFLQQPIGFEREKEQLLFNLAGARGARTDRAAEVAAFLRRSSAKGLVIVDEVDQLKNARSRTAFADLIKHLSDSHPGLTLLLVGVADSVTSLIGDHPSIERCLRQIQLPRMSDVELGEIVDKGAKVGGMSFEPEARQVIVTSSRGFPHYAHLLGKHAVLAAFDDGRQIVALAHFSTGLEAAIQDATASVRSEYRLATASTRPSLYREVLLAAALAQEDVHGTVQPRDLVAPLSVLAGRKLRLGQFFPHLSSLCTPERGQVLEKLGQRRRYRYRFRNPLLKPFVVLMGRRDRLPIERALAASLGAQASAGA